MRLAHHDPSAPRVDHEGLHKRGNRAPCRHLEKRGFAWRKLRQGMRAAARSVAAHTGTIPRAVTRRACTSVA